MFEIVGLNVPPIVIFQRPDGFFCRQQASVGGVEARGRLSRSGAAPVP